MKIEEKGKDLEIIIPVDLETKENLGFYLTHFTYKRRGNLEEKGGAETEKLHLEKNTKVREKKDREFV